MSEDNPASHYNPHCYTTIEKWANKFWVCSPNLKFPKFTKQTRHSESLISLSGQWVRSTITEQEVHNSHCNVYERLLLQV